MSEVRGGTGARGNPPPRRALSRVSPLDAEDAPGSPVDPAARPAELSPAAAPGGTEGRDLLIPGHQNGRGKNGRPVPSLADLMPPSAPSGRRHGGGSGGHHHKVDHAKREEKAGTKADGKADDKGGKTVELSVPLTKPVRKKLKARAADLGMSPQATVAQLVEVWLEG